MNSKQRSYHAHKTYTYTHTHYYNYVYTCAYSNQYHLCTKVKMTNKGNALEPRILWSLRASYAFNMKSTMEDDKVKDKVDKKEHEEVISQCKEVI